MIIILTGVDDNAGVAVDNTGEVLVYDGALHVDIQDRLFMSDFDKYMLELEENAKK